MNQNFYSQQYYMELNAKIILAQLQSILISLGQLNITDPIILQKIKTANELLSVGNTQACAVVLNVSLFLIFLK